MAEKLGSKNLTAAGEQKFLGAAILRKPQPLYKGNILLIYFLKYNSIIS